MLAVPVLSALGCLLEAQQAAVDVKLTGAALHDTIQQSRPGHDPYAVQSKPAAAGKRWLVVEASLKPPGGAPLFLDSVVVRGSDGAESPLVGLGGKHKAVDACDLLEPDINMYAFTAGVGWQVHPQGSPQRLAMSTDAAVPFKLLFEVPEGARGLALVVAGQKALPLDPAKPPAKPKES